MYFFLYDRKNCPNCLTSGVVSGCSQRSILMIVYHGHEVVFTSIKNIMHIVYMLWTFYKINAKIGFWPKFCGSLCEWGMVSQIHIIFFIKTSVFSYKQCNLGADNFSRCLKLKYESNLLLVQLFFYYKRAKFIIL